MYAFGRKQCPRRTTRGVDIPGLTVPTWHSRVASAKSILSTRGWRVQGLEHPPPSSCRTGPGWAQRRVEPTPTAHHWPVAVLTANDCGPTQVTPVGSAVAPRTPAGDGHRRHRALGRGMAQPAAEGVRVGAATVPGAAQGRPEARRTGFGRAGRPGRRHRGAALGGEGVGRAALGGRRTAARGVGHQDLVGRRRRHARHRCRRGGAHAEQGRRCDTESGDHTGPEETAGDYDGTDGSDGQQGLLCAGPGLGYCGRGRLPRREGTGRTLPEREVVRACRAAPAGRPPNRSPGRDARPRDRAPTAETCRCAPGFPSYRGAGPE